MPSRIAFLLAALLAQTAGAQTAAQLYEEVKRDLDGQGFLTFERVTSQGQSRACELNYRYVFRDRRAKRGEPVLVYGSLFSSRPPGKTFGLFLKVKTADLLVPPQPGRQ